MITAKQVLETLNAEDSAAFAAGEQRIDKALSAYDGRPVLVDFGRAAPKRKVLARLCEMYRKGGWTAEIKHGDQRDPGPWIEFAHVGEGIPDR